MSRSEWARLIGRYLERRGIVADLAAWRTTLALDPATLARRALAGDHVARVVASLSARWRWFELTGEVDALPLDMIAQDARRARRRARRRRLRRPA